MWTHDNEKEYQELLARYKTDPKQDPKKDAQKDDFKLIQTLFDEYRETGDIQHYKRVTQFLNIFLDAGLPDEVASDPKQLAEFLESRPELSTQFQFFKVINDHYRIVSDYQEFDEIKNAQKECQDALETFEALLRPEMDQKDFAEFHEALLLGEKNFQSSRIFNGIINIRDNPSKKNPQRPEDVSYHTLVDRVLATALQKQIPGSKIDMAALENQKAIFLKKAYATSNTRSVISLLQGYDSYQTTPFKSVNHLTFKEVGPKSKPTSFYPNLSLEDILPHPKFMTLEKYRNKNSNGTGDPTVIARIITKENPQFQGYTVLGKISGKDPGFILVSPDKSKRFFLKKTEDMYQEYFCSAALTDMGIKMPEASLVSDNFGNVFYASLDLSRTYQKGEKHKIKAFEPMSSVVVAPQVAYGFEVEKGHSPQPALEEQQKEMDDFLEKTFGPKGSEDPGFVKTRQSFAKLLLIGTIYNLTDLAAHGGNIGPYTTTVAGKTITKFGICDFAFKPYDISTLPESVLDRLEEKMSAKSTAPVFREMYKRLSPEDFKNAAEELAAPKAREYSPQGMLLVQAPKSKTSSSEILQGTVQRVVKELLTLPDQEAAKAEIPNIVQAKNIFISNHKFAAESILKKPDAAEAKPRRPSV